MTKSVNIKGVHAHILPRLFAAGVYAETDQDRRAIILFRPVPRGFLSEISAVVAAIDPSIAVEPAPAGSPTGAKRRAFLERERLLADNERQYAYAAASRRASVADGT